MNLETIAAAVAILIATSGALIQIIRVIVQHTTDLEFDKVSARISRLERRQAILEMRVSGDSDTFSPQ